MNLTVNLNINSKPIIKPINRFYPYFIYVNNPITHKQAKNELERTIKEMQHVNI